MASCFNTHMSESYRQIGRFAKLMRRSAHALTSKKEKKNQTSPVLRKDISFLTKTFLSEMLKKSPHKVFACISRSNSPCQKHFLIL